MYRGTWQPVERVLLTGEAFRQREAFRMLPCPKITCNLDELEERQERQASGDPRSGEDDSSPISKLLRLVHSVYDFGWTQTGAVRQVHARLCLTRAAIPKLLACLAARGGDCCSALFLAPNLQTHNRRVFLSFDGVVLVALHSILLSFQACTCLKGKTSHPSVHSLRSAPLPNNHSLFPSTPSPHPHLSFSRHSLKRARARARKPPLRFVLLSTNNNSALFIQVLFKSQL